MIDPDENNFFAGLVLDEPSGELDRRILALARNASARSAPLSRWVPALGVAAAALLIAGGIYCLLAALGPGGGQPSEKSPLSIRAAISGLRADLEEIDEMSELIPPERQAEREAIIARVRACLEDVEKLQLRLSLDVENSSVIDPSRKEDRV